MIEKEYFVSYTSVGGDYNTAIFDKHHVAEFFIKTLAGFYHIDEFVEIVDDDKNNGDVDEIELELPREVIDGNESFNRAIAINICEEDLV